MITEARCRIKYTSMFNIVLFEMPLDFAGVNSWDIARMKTMTACAIIRILVFSNALLEYRTVCRKLGSSVIRIHNNFAVHFMLFSSKFWFNHIYNYIVNIRHINMAAALPVQNAGKVSSMFTVS